MLKSCIDKNPFYGDNLIVMFRPEMPDATSILNVTRYSLAIKRGEVYSVFPNKIIAYSPVSIPFSPIPGLPNITFKIENIAVEEEVRLNLRLFEDIMKSDVLNYAAFLNFKPSLTPEMESLPCIPTDEVNKLLRTTGMENFIPAEGGESAIFSKKQLSVFPYFIPHLIRLTSASTKTLINNISRRKKEYDGVIGVLKGIASDPDINKLAASLPINDNMWQIFKTQSILPLINRVAKKKQEIKPEADLQALLVAMAKKLPANIRQANADKSLILAVKNNTIRALQVTFLEIYARLNKLAASDPAKAKRLKDFKNFMETFDARIVIEGSTEYLSFSALYYKKNLTQIADDLNAHRNSEFAAALQDNLRKCGNMNYLVRDADGMDWTKTVINANNPVLLPQEEKELQIIVESFFTECDKKLNDQSLKSEAELIYDQVEKIKQELIKIKELWSNLNTTIQKLKVVIKEAGTHITAQAKLVAAQQKTLVQLNIEMKEHAPALSLLELQNTSGHVNASLAIVQQHLNDIGSAKSYDDALKVSQAADAELVTLTSLQENLQTGQNKVSEDRIQADIKIHETRLDLWLRHNFALIKTAAYDVSFWAENTTKFLCMGGTTVLMDDKAVKVPRGVAEILGEIKKLETHQNMSTKQVIDTLTAIRKIALGALERTNKMTTFYSRKTPTQQMYEAIVNQINVNIKELLENEIPKPLDLSHINQQWAVSLAEDRYYNRHDLSTTDVSSESRFTDYSNNELSQVYSISASA